MSVKPGQIWREVDMRFSRYVKIVSIFEDGKRAVIHSVNPHTHEKAGPITKASVTRFNGKHGGYELVKEPA
ncbi:hypothetical protein [Paraburkholderia sp. BL9I2N2]|uniref:hypothetical protein n=1 Tax=Paraburkholderia sp. BL9I2N2 TaxID=1938809 RepID=UPI001053A1EE|nr:hypothetical protein [Paraburkholderia sp. BL9I2N2]TCK87339.1 hypothetical protein B0G74_7878 [Paraburkholderia sp. BL9I2N2]